MKTADQMNKMYLKKNKLIKVICKIIKKGAKTKGMRLCINVKDYEISQVNDTINYFKGLGYKITIDKGISFYDLHISWKRS